jgi:hypothetical protein
VLRFCDEKAQRAGQKRSPDAENADQIFDFSSGGAARQSAQKRSAPPSPPRFAAGRSHLVLSPRRLVEPPLHDSMGIESQQREHPEP